MFRLWSFRNCFCSRFKMLVMMMVVAVVVVLVVRKRKMTPTH